MAREASEMKYIMKKINTQLTVKLMEGKCVRDVWSDFFKGQIPEGVIKSDNNHFMGDLGITEKQYDFVLNNCKDEGFVNLLRLEGYEFLDTEELRNEIYKITPFVGKKGDRHRILIRTEIEQWTLDKHLNSTGEFTIGIETCTYVATVTESDVKAWNKDHARVLRKYLVGLPSVQGVPYQCSYKDNVEVERSCEV